MEKARCNTELYSNLRAPLKMLNRPTFGGHIIEDSFLFYDKGIGDSALTFVVEGAVVIWVVYYAILLSPKS